MKLNQKGFNDVITVTIIGGIIGALFIAGVFVWREVENNKQPEVIVVEKIIKVDDSGNNVEDRQEINKNILVGDSEVDCKISGGDWITGDTCGTFYTCEGKYQQSINPVLGVCPISTEDDWVSYCECGAGFCWDGESCVDFSDYKTAKKGQESLSFSNLLAQNSSINQILYFPDNYNLVKRTNEPGRRGSFVSFYFSGGGSTPILNEVQLFSLESIAECNEKQICFFGDYPTVDRYLGMRSAFRNGDNYNGYESMEFNGTKYFVNSYRVVEDIGYIRQYTTFFGDTEVDIWINILDISQNEEADNLMKSIKWKANIQPW